MTKADLARALTTSKSNVTQLLSGDRNMTLTTLSDIASALGLSPNIYLAETSHQCTAVHQRVFDVMRYVEKSKQTISLAYPASGSPYRHFAILENKASNTTLAVSQ